MTIFLTHAGEREALARAPFMSRPPRRVIYEGVNLERFRPDPAAGRAFRERQRLGDGPSVLAVGALEREKRYGWLLGALARLPEPRPRLVVCGDGGLADALRSPASRSSGWDRNTERRSKRSPNRSRWPPRARPARC